MGVYIGDPCSSSHPTVDTATKRLAMGGPEADRGDRYHESKGQCVTQSPQQSAPILLELERLAGDEHLGLELRRGRPQLRSLSIDLLPEAQSPRDCQAVGDLALPRLGDASEDLAGLLIAAEMEQRAPKMGEVRLGMVRIETHPFSPIPRAPRGDR